MLVMLLINAQFLFKVIVVNLDINFHFFQSRHKSNHLKIILMQDRRGNIDVSEILRERNRQPQMYLSAWDDDFCSPTPSPVCNRNERSSARIVSPLMAEKYFNGQYDID